MLGLPFISEYINQVVKPQAVADSVDHLNFYCTSLLLAIFALAISAKQYFGSPIQCFLPSEFKAGWEEYTENYCFIQNLYSIPDHEPIPENLDRREDQLSYYRWVPVVLALQALMFFAPNFLWRALYKQTAIQPNSVVIEARKCTSLRGAQREDEIRNLASYIDEIISVFSFGRKENPGATRSGKNATFLYLFTKLFYLINIVGQFYMMNHFLGGGYFAWGFETMKSVASGNMWNESAIFPRVILCDFQVRRLANNNRHTVQCVIMLNMINEKLYLFLWFWMILVGCCTLLNFIYYQFIMLIPSARAQVILWKVNKLKLKEDGRLSKWDLNNFVHRFLRSDGVLLIKFIDEHAGSKVARELVNELLSIYAKRLRESWSREPINPFPSEKSPLINGQNRGDNNYYGNYDKGNSRPFYANGNGHRSPLPQLLRSPADSSNVNPVESAPAFDQLIDGSTRALPHETVARARTTAQLSDNGSVNVSLTSGPRQSTPTKV